MIDETKKAETNKRKRERERESKRFSPVVVSETQKIASHAAMGEKERERERQRVCEKRVRKSE